MNCDRNGDEADRRSIRKTLIIILGLATLFTAGGAASCLAQNYFKGKTVTIYSGRPPGGANDSEMRLVAQQLANHIPGNPNIIAENMPGAGGVVLANYIFGIAPRNGLTLAIPGRTAFLLAPMTGNANARYDLLKLTWIGSAASSNFMLWIRRGTNIRTFDELKTSTKELIIGADAEGNSDTVMPELLVKYQKLPFKIVKGYSGAAELALAMQRGEVDGMFLDRSSFGVDPVSSGLAVPVLQTFAIEPGIPILEEIASDPVEKGLFQLFEVPLHVGLAVVAPPQLSPHVTSILRQAYVQAVSSEDYRQKAAQRGFALGQPNSGGELADYVARNLTNVSADVLHEFRSYVQ